MVLSIHYLRGLAALIVVCFHYRPYLNDSFSQIEIGDILFANGAFGVDLFFIISGFIICLSTERKEPLPVISFVLKRFFRIYPLFFVSLLLFLLFIGPQEQSLLEAFIPLHADYDKAGPFFGYHLLSPVWTLIYELAFYALFMCAMLCSKRYRKPLAVLLIGGLFLLLQWWTQAKVDLSAYQTVEHAGPNQLAPFIAIFSSPMVLEFIFGIVLFLIYQAVPVLTSQRWARAVAYLCVLIALLAGAALYHPFFYGHGPLKWGLPSFILLLSVLIYEKQKGLPHLNFLFFLGNISFSLYLLHMIVIKLMRRHEWLTDGHGLFVFVVALGLSLLGAYGIYQAVEQRSVQLCRTILSALQDVFVSAKQKNKGIAR